MTMSWLVLFHFTCFNSQTHSSNCSLVSSYFQFHQSGLVTKFSFIHLKFVFSWNEPDFFPFESIDVRQRNEDKNCNIANEHNFCYSPLDPTGTWNRLEVPSLLIVNQQSLRLWPSLRHHSQPTPTKIWMRTKYWWQQHELLTYAVKVRPGRRHNVYRAKQHRKNSQINKALQKYRVKTVSQYAQERE